LVNYYHNLGWIGDPARDQLLAYADGLLAPEGAVEDWRTNVEVHEKSLLFVEKLRAVAYRHAG
ncbi:MAG TPA: FlaD/FlaE family flagellar protein, partial [Candidatus Thermoplasmatota archaeon]|nr:FlaD/FlaE family flagellar protein [Candidatus Thermoplasmatota archaeon]